MDSGDDDGDDGAEDSESAEEAPLPASAAEVRSFAEMVRMADGLRSGAPRMPTSELAAVCVAAGRVRFYDAALLGAVAAQLRQRLSGGRAGGLGAEELVAVLASLAELNAYDRDLFSAAARVLGTGGAAAALDAAQLKVLLTAFRSVKHTSDEAFVEALAQRERQARYEAAKANIIKDELERRWVR